MSMKTAQEARKGDRVWVKRYPTRHLEEVVIDNPEHWTESDDFNEDWGYLADNETVIGGQMLRNPKPNLWYLGIGSYWADSILGNHKAFDDWCKTLDLSDADITAIVDHVRKHSAADKPKRTAKDARTGDEIWRKDGGKIVKDKVYSNYSSGRVAANYDDATEYYTLYDYAVFGIEWGFWEDRPQVQEAKPEQPRDEPKAQPAPQQPSPQFGNVKLLIKSKGLDWVKANIPDAYAAYQAHRDAGIRASREAYDKLAKPGILAGKTASPY